MADVISTDVRSSHFFLLSHEMLTVLCTTASVRLLPTIDALSTTSFLRSRHSNRTCNLLVIKRIAFRLRPSIPNVIRLSPIRTRISEVCAASTLRLLNPRPQDPTRVGYRQCDALKSGPGITVEERVGSRSGYAVVLGAPSGYQGTSQQTQTLSEHYPTPSILYARERPGLSSQMVDNDTWAIV